jgi:alkylation response protein AidB-like acyl-CoA dehydrogenase
MNFGFTEEQDVLRREARRFLDERSPIDSVRRVMETPTGYDEGLWKELAELGWLGLIIPEAYGGAGLTWIDLVVILEETGRSLLPSPLISNTLTASAILQAGSDEQKQRWLPALAHGETIGALAFMEESDSIDPTSTGLTAKPDGDGFVLTGEKHFVSDPEAAGLFVVSFRCGEAPEEVGLALIEAGSHGVTAQSFPTIDDTKRLGNLRLDGVRVGPDQILGEPGSAGAMISRLIDMGAVAVTAEMSGAVEEALRITVKYANERIQFGHPIGHYQGVKHPLAEMHTDLESFRALLYYAAWCIQNRSEELARFASLAKAYATDTFVRAGLDCVQIHGAIGFSVACDIHLYFKRSKWARPMYGDAATHYERAFALRGV